VARTTGGHRRRHLRGPAATVMLRWTTARRSSVGAGLEFAQRLEGEYDVRYVGYIMKTGDIHLGYCNEYILNTTLDTTIMIMNTS
jgi:hypothetical protein